MPRDRTIQVYCDKCKTSSWILFDESKISKGLLKRVIIHTDHVVIAEIDRNGSVRTTQIVEVEFSPLDTLVEDVAQGLHYLNSEDGRPIQIDAYTTNPQFTKFMQSIIVEMFRQATSNRVEDRYRFIATAHEARTTLHSDRVHFSIGPFIKMDINDLKDPYKGIILDVIEAEKNKLDIESVLSKYNWVAIIVQKEKKEGYYHAFSSLFEAKGQPFFIETLNNKTLKELFDFIFAITLQIPN